MRIYTRTGDTGFSSTGNRRMIPKNSPVFSLLGALEELDASLGEAAGKLPEGLVEVAGTLRRDVAALSAELSGGEKFADAARVRGMEESIDLMMESAGAGAPDGSRESAGAAALGVSRAIARRAEREMASAKQTGGVTPDAMRYLNRLSDLLYAMARMADAQGPGPAAPPADFGGGFLERALELCRRVLAEARRENLRVTAAVCDEGGSPTALLRDDGALLASVEIARDKAFTSAAMRMSTEELAGLCKPGGSLYGLQHTNGGRIVIFGGGVPLVEGNRLVGGFGVSGGTAEQDTNLANYALKVFSAGIREEYSR